MKDLTLAALPAFAHSGDCDCIDFACNDDGDGGICTHCGELHTATVVSCCEDCCKPTDGIDRKFCRACIAVMGKK